MDGQVEVSSLSLSCDVISTKMSAQNMEGKGEDAEKAIASLDNGGWSHNHEGKANKEELLFERTKLEPMY